MSQFRHQEPSAKRLRSQAIAPTMRLYGLRFRQIANRREPEELESR